MAAEQQPMEANERGLVEKIEEKFHKVVGGGDGDHHGSSSDSDDDKKATPPPPVSAAAAAAAAAASSSPHEQKVFRLFGRERPVHHLLGGGKPADVLLWRDRRISAGVLGAATAIWILFELLEYNLLTLLGHALIFALAALFLWSNVGAFINKSRPRIPEVSIPEDQTIVFALRLRDDINKALAVLRNISLGRDLKKFLGVIAGLWVLSVVGSWADFLTLFYILFVMLHTVPVLYEKYEHKVDPLAEKAMSEFNKHYAVVQAKVVDKIPRGPMKDKKN